MRITDLCEHLNNVSVSHRGYKASCPAHDDKSPSLSLCEKDGKILLHCFAGCTTQEIVSALGITMSDLFCDAYGLRGNKIVQNIKRPFRRALTTGEEVENVLDEAHHKRLSYPDAKSMLDMIVGLNDADHHTALLRLQQIWKITV